MLFRLAETLGIADVDDLAEMPMSLLGEWVAYFSIKAEQVDGKGARVSAPTQMEALMRARYGGRSSGTPTRGR